MADSPEVPTINVNKLRERLPEYRSDLESFRRAYGQLQENYPDFFERIERENLTMNLTLDQMEEILTTLDQVQEKSDDEILDYVELYNKLAVSVNFWFTEDSLNSPESVMGPIVRGETIDPQVFETLTKEQEQELIKFADELYKEIFPDSYTDKAVMYWTNRSELSDFQRYMLMPANAIESVATGLVELFDPETWRDLKNSTKTLTEMEYEDYVLAWEFLKFQYKHMETNDKVIPAVTFILSVAFLLGGISKVSKFAKSAGYSKKLVYALEAVIITRSFTHNAGPAVNTIPAQVLGGLNIKYMDWEELSAPGAKG